jgi:alcohol dehydrogenase class IV
VPTSTFRAPDAFCFGVGALDDLGKHTSRLGGRAVLVTGRSAMAEAGITDRAVASLKSSGIDVTVFDEVEPEPDVTTVDRLREVLARHGADVAVGLGGGSAMDAAKVAAGLVHETQPTRAFHEGAEVTELGIPMIAVPSTSGTGSEMTNNGVISDREKGYKASIRHPGMIPAVALVDPEVTVPCPPDVTAMSGVDALVQAIESYLSRHATPMTEAIALRAAAELARALPGVVTQGDDLDLRTAAAWGSAMAGLALSNARLGVVHGMAHPIGVRYGVPHGLVCGVLLPLAMEYNREAAGEKFERLREVLGGDPVGYAQALLVATGLPLRLNEYGLDRADFEAIARETMASGSTKANPREVTEEDVVRLCEQVA